MEKHRVYLFLGSEVPSLILTNSSTWIWLFWRRFNLLLEDSLSCRQFSDSLSCCQFWTVVLGRAWQSLALLALLGSILTFLEKLSNPKKWRYTEIKLSFSGQHWCTVLSEWNWKTQIHNAILLHKNFMHHLIWNVSLMLKTYLVGKSVLALLCSKMLLWIWAV